MTTLTELAAAHPGLARVDSLRYSSGLGKPLVYLVISGNVTARQTLHPMVKLVGRYQDAVGLYLLFVFLEMALALFINVLTTIH